MASYRLELSNQAIRVLRQIAKGEFAVYRRLQRALDDLQMEPYLGKPLKGKLKGRWSYRVGTYRILYRFERKRLIVYIIDVGHRRDIYR